MVNLDVVLNWMEYIRNNPENAFRFTQNFYESQSVTSLLINHPKLLLRKKQEVWPKPMSNT